MHLLWGMCEGQYIEKWEYQEEFLLSPPVSKLENFLVQLGQVRFILHVVYCSHIRMPTHS